MRCHFPQMPKAPSSAATMSGAAAATTTGAVPRVPPPAASAASASSDPPPSSAPTAALTYQQLSAFDDLCTAALVDPQLGFTSHKMAVRHRRPPPEAWDAFRRAVDRFRASQDYEAAWAEVSAVDWWARAAKRTVKPSWQPLLKEHVSGLAF